MANHYLPCLSSKSENVNLCIKFFPMGRHFDAGPLTIEFLLLFFY